MYLRCLKCIRRLLNNLQGTGNSYSDNQNIIEMHPFTRLPSSRFMQIVLNKSLLTQGPQVQAGRGRSHCKGNYSLHGMVMKAFFLSSRASEVLVLSSLLHCWPGRYLCLFTLSTAGRPAADRTAWQSELIAPGGGKKDLKFI